MKNYNWKKGILFFIICGLVGALLGGILKSLDLEEGNVQHIVDRIVAVAPSLFVLAFVLGMIGIGGYIYFNVKLKREHYSDEEGSFYERNEKLMSVTAACATLCAIVNFTALGVNIFTVTTLVALFMVNVIIAFLGEVAHISLIKKVRPELDADPLQVDFSKSHFDKLDECEKNKTGRASFNTVAAMTPVYVGLFVVCYGLSVFLKISPVICLPIGVLWAVQTILLTYYSNKQSKA